MVRSEATSQRRRPPRWKPRVTLGSVRAQKKKKTLASDYDYDNEGLAVPNQIRGEKEKDTFLIVFMCQKSIHDKLVICFISS